MAEYRIDELARAAGTTVRNVRVYQDRGLLPPPRRAGRVGIFSEAHLARLRLIGQLLDRGYTFAHITELVSAWEQGRGLGQVLGLEEALTGPWSDEIPGYVTAAELREMYGDQFSEDVVTRSIATGNLEPEGDRYRVPSMRLLHAGAEMVAAGIPLESVLELADDIRADIEPLARRLVRVTADHILAGHDADWIPAGEEATELAALIQRLRPLAQMAVEAYLARAMEEQMQELLDERFAHLVEQRRDLA